MYVCIHTNTHMRGYIHTCTHTHTETYRFLHWLCAAVVSRHLGKNTLAYNGTVRQRLRRKLDWHFVCGESITATQARNISEPVSLSSKLAWPRAAGAHPSPNVFENPKRSKQRQTTSKANRTKSQHHGKTQLGYFSAFCVPLVLLLVALTFLLSGILTACRLWLVFIGGPLTPYWSQRPISKCEGPHPSGISAAGIPTWSRTHCRVLAVAPIVKGRGLIEMKRNITTGTCRFSSLDWTWCLLAYVRS